MQRGLRYGILAIVVLTVAALGLLLGIAVSDGGPSPMDPPERPEVVTQSSAVTFAEALERTRVHNAVVQTDPERVEIGCDSSYVEETPAGHYVLARCGATTYDDGSVSSRIPSTAFYRVSGDGHGRVPRRGQRVDSAATPSTAQTVGHPVALSLYNLRDRSAAFAVTVTYRGANETVSSSYGSTADPREGRVLDGVFTASGTYRVRVEVDGRVVARTWDLSDDAQRLLVVHDASGTRLVPVRSP